MENSIIEKKDILPQRQPGFEAPTEWEELNDIELEKVVGSGDNPWWVPSYATLTYNPKPGLKFDNFGGIKYKSKFEVKLTWKF
ncbi:MAG: hypothetical protein F6K22_23750 [Okeania sp. SIO2F4]|uniref:hypothetical protein n=1 Tax=Okeania sp. SIO2F4 TaxID=2607790 RepID=UPI00142B1A68|nr:hypothetical protein [Okeania sp. SIO2F4]MDJ0516387.1 hypothetical protein [Trichodesmium sp. MO_231.B1]NES05559.1 hypothetical protein [Okeania sp. SIO2F4]